VLKPRHLYVHVPFCGRRCVYCDFSIAVRRATPVAEFNSALSAELDAVSRELALAPDSWTLDTVYLGGGTPSRLGVDGIAGTLDLVRARATLSPGAEVTIEANPEDISAEAVRGWLAAGVNRISLGAQSFDAAVLAWMHRSHSGDDIAKAIGILRDAGLENFSLDLIYALPASLQRSWTDDLERAASLAPPHISLYGLTVEPRTPLERSITAGEILPGEEDSYAAEFLEAHERLTSAGYSHYEVSNYAREGLASRHNAAYWTGADYLGIGPSAHSLLGGMRRWNIRAYESWMRSVSAGLAAVEGSETLTEAARTLEAAYLGLRTARGVELAPEDQDRIARWVEAGWATTSGKSTQLTPSGWLRLDELVADLRGTTSGDNYISRHGSPAA
jgi:oxygen-independent coproporphyrinogen III oxidase